MTKKTVRVLSGTIDWLLISIFTLMMLLGLYALYDSYSLYKSAQDKSILIYKPQPDSVYTEVPLDGYVAWLTLNGTEIDYPIMQGIDNNEFLNKDPYGNYSLSGSIFLDSRNSSDFTDEYSLVYGHHMEHGAMFGALDNYKDRSYCRAHKNGTLMVGGKVYELDIFASVITHADKDIVFNPEHPDRDALMRYIQENAVYYDEIYRDAGNRILALSTCSSDGSMERFVVFATINE